MGTRTDPHSSLRGDGSSSSSIKKEEIVDIPSVHKGKYFFAGLFVICVISGIVVLCLVLIDNKGNSGGNNSKDDDVPTPTPTNYYANINPDATNDTMKLQLQNLINPHTVLSYDDVWAAFSVVDKKLPPYPCSSNLTLIPDVYSSNCWIPAKVDPGGECGNYATEGDCYNREHIWPKSWFGGFDEGENAQTDLFELWPSDGYVNGLRGNLPFGEVTTGTESYISSNGCIIGNCDALPGEQCFEPAQYLKGDLARSYFYLSTAYWNKWGCCEEVGVNRSSINEWMESTIRKWHASDPPDTYEEERNDIIYSQFQGNRNPFIDHPEWVDQIDDF